MADWQKIEEELIARAWEDEKFRDLLIRDPQAALAQAGLTLPADAVLKVIPDIPEGEIPAKAGVHTLVVPPRPNIDEMDEIKLSEEELEMVAGGGGRTSSTCRQRTCAGYAYARQMSCLGCRR